MSLNHIEALTEALKKAKLKELTNSDFKVSFKNTDLVYCLIVFRTQTLK